VTSTFKALLERYKHPGSSISKLCASILEVGITSIHMPRQATGMDGWTHYACIIKYRTFPNVHEALTNHKVWPAKAICQPSLSQPPAGATVSIQQQHSKHSPSKCTPPALPLRYPSARAQ
jgi:hypothetical protein